ncbi:glycosyltransferase [Phaeobacter sp. 11ANDIMAR09]|uniref:glycosyltransferase n=1 Tax=Phaeobacter sp. 11ANDIMAR09 TaxID=1225647 RepID=UPI0006C86ABB|nr:glycosyltransferase [Phaeobacter sp. 11ANDIMAR09]KPD11541.1 hypothetical protein AN476_14950 [Phaeobacter sp. 11ANDIMAR09]
MLTKYDIVFMPHKDYHSSAMYPIANALEAHGFSSAFLEPTENHRANGAIEALEGKPVAWIPNEDFTSRIRSPKAVLVMNDWDVASSHLLSHCQSMGIDIIGLQEGTTDFLRKNWNNKGYSDPNRLPYTKSDFLLLASEFDATYFAERPHAIIGMDRVEPLFHEPVSFPSTPLVLININFSFKTCLEFSRDWLVDVATSCEALGLEYVLSVHPQDETDLTGYEDKVSEAPLHDLLKESTLFISRFSNAIYESLALGKPVVYYNPHDEGSRTFNEAEGAFSVAKTAASLKESIAFEIEQRDIRERARAYFDSHLSIVSGRTSTERAVEAIVNRFQKQSSASPGGSLSQSENDRVSIILPVYNVADYLDRCLDSIISQSHRNLEIIAVNDASTDNSLKILQEYARLDERILVINRPLQLGLSSARNLAMMRASGKAMMFVDSDDWLAYDACEKAFSKLVASDSDVTVFDCFDYFQPNSKWVSHYDCTEIENGTFKRHNFAKICAVWTKIYRTDFLRRIGAHFPDGANFEDWFWTVQWSTQAGKISAISAPLYFYRRNRPGSITAGKRTEAEQMRNIVRNLSLSKAYLDARGLDYLPLTVLLNKADIRVRPDKSDMPEPERRAAYSVLTNYLTKEFPFGLPKGVVSPSIVAAYAEQQPQLQRED